VSGFENLDKLFNPASLAVVGASSDRHKAGGRFVKGLIDGGYKGNIYPVNPNASEILGLRNYHNVLDLPEDIDLAIVSVPAQSVPQVIAECGIRRIKFAVVHSAGFSELGDEGKALERKTLRLASAGGTRIIGPNCMGLYVPRSHINTIVFGASITEPGGVAFVGQSGWVTENVVVLGNERGLHFSKIASIGNQADLTIEDMLGYLAEDPETRVITLYVEGLKRGADFLRIAKAASKQKPVIVWKAGRSKTGARAASSHTGSLAGDSSVFDAAAAQSGIVLAHDLDDLIDLMVGFSCPVWTRGRKVAILCESGGGAVSASDTAEAFDLEVPALSAVAQKEMVERLTGVIPPFAPPRNPVDLVWGPVDNPGRLFVDCGRIMLHETNAAVMLDYQRFDENLARQIADLRDETQKPIFMVPGYVTQTRPGMAVLTGLGVPTFDTPAKAIRVLAEMVRFSLRAGDVL
jgi:acyl-CoA synthetase (NDP forming)